MRFALLLLLLAQLVALTPRAALAQSSGAVLPFLGSAPETGLQYGIAYLRTRHADDSLGTRPSSLMGNIIYTAEGQFRTFVESDRWSAGNERRRQWGVVVMAYPLPFHGPNTENESVEDLGIENDVVEAWINRSRKLRPAMWGSLGARLIVNTSEGGYGHASLYCDTLPAPPECALIDAALAHPFAHSTVMFTAAAAHDTRDLLFAPTNGRLTDITVAIAYDATHEEPFVRLRLDARRYRRAGSGVLAWQAVLHGTEGRAPVDQIVVMGSNVILRGYEQGRHRDNWLAGAQGEWRHPTPVLRGRLSLAAFAGGAVMARSVDALASGRMFPSFGGGIRYRLDARSGSAVRIDFGKGRGANSGLYVAFNEAF